MISYISVANTDLTGNPEVFVIQAHDYDTGKMIGGFVNKKELIREIESVGYTVIPNADLPTVHVTDPDAESPSGTFYVRPRAQSKSSITGYYDPTDPTQIENARTKAYAFLALSKELAHADRHIRAEKVAALSEQFIAAGIPATRDVIEALVDKRVEVVIPNE